MEIICNKTDFYKNPNKLPLDQLYFDYKTINRTAKDDVALGETLEAAEKPQDFEKWRGRYHVKVEKKPALDKCWLQEEKRYVEFQPFYPQFDDKENNEFLAQNQEFLEVLRHLIDCTYHQFWCHIACEPRVAHIITHFLEHSVSLYATLYLSDVFLALYDEIYTCICSIFERLLEFNSSETEYMSEGVAIGFLRRNGLLSAHTVFLVCFLYNHSRPQFVRRLIDFYFCDKYKEMYGKELDELLTDVSQEFEKLDALELLSSRSGSVLRRKPEKFDPAWLEDVSSYILEMAGALNEFLSVCRPAVEVIFDLEVPFRLSHTYQKVYTQLYDVLDSSGEMEIGFDWSRYEVLINRWLSMGRSVFIDLFYGFSCHLLDKVLNSRDDRAEQEQHLEVYLGLISAALDDDLFIRDYNKAYPVESQFQILNDSAAAFDKTQTEYLLKSLQGIISAVDYEDEPKNKPKSPEKHKNKLGSPTQTDESTKEPFPQELYESIYDTLTQYSEVQSSESTPSTSTSSAEIKNLPEPVVVAVNQYVELVKQWKDDPDCWNLNPDLWDDFESQPPETNLSEDDIEQRIRTVLEMLPDLKSAFVLKCLERMDYRPELVISRVLDNDVPADLLDASWSALRSLDTAGPSRPKFTAYVGKKPDYHDAKDLLDDKTTHLKNLVLKASYAYDVDDDYDDRNEVSFQNEDESKIYRHLKPDAREYNVISDPSSSSEDESKPTNAFCEDPAIIRARRAAQRGRNYAPPTRDLVGRPKGQGQDKNVQQNRDKKNVHKSARANHNRKGGAMWKRNKGMVPS